MNHLNNLFAGAFETRDMSPLPVNQQKATPSQGQESVPFHIQVIQLVDRSNIVLCISYQLLGHCFYAGFKYRLLYVHDQNRGLNGSVTNQQGMLTPYRHLISHLVFPGVPVFCPSLNVVFFVRLVTVHYLHLFSWHLDLLILTL